jgi:alkanesulfonate monooxygenase SsuD/methylene tetrahydromethanopterin reductase-like flavin-dependent oxidoreductase (luciferase family)
MRRGWIGSALPCASTLQAAVATPGTSIFHFRRSYQQVIAREGVAGAADLAAVGSAESVRRRLQSYLDAGATDVVLSGMAWADAAAADELWAVAASL